MSFTPEEHLILQCVQAEMTREGIASAIGLLRQELDWDYILDASIRHAVSPLLYNGLSQVSRDMDVEIDSLAPSTILAQLRALFLGAQRRNRRLYGVLADICEAFERAGVQVMGLKDVQLAREVYPDIGLRPMGDIDLLIHRQDYAEAARCLRALGFAPLPGPDIPFTLKYALGHDFARPTDNTWVDLQWGIMQREWDSYHEGNLDFETERMWCRARAIPVGGSQILVPSPEDMLFHLCLHLEGHKYGELVLLCDVLELLRCYGSSLDWAQVTGLARKHKVEFSIYYVLLLVERLFGAHVSPEVLEELRPDYFKAHLFGPLLGNLARLHYSLDEIRLAARPPREVMRAYEVVVRAQTAGAMQFYRLLDGAISDFLRRGGTLVIADGEASERIVPAPALRPFGELYLFILNNDLPRMERALLGQGFEAPGRPGAQSYVKRWRFASGDPALAGRPLTLAARVDVTTQRTQLGPHGAGYKSSRQIALKVLRSRGKARRERGTDLPLHVSVVALPPEELLLNVSARLGREKANVLFNSCALLEFLGHYRREINWQRVADLARRQGALEPLARALDLAVDLLDVDCGELRMVARDVAAGAPRGSRLFEWARHGPESAARPAGLRNAFSYLLTLRSLDDNRARLAYLARSLLGTRRAGPVLPGLLLGLASAVLSSWRKKPATPRDFAYWIEPEPAVGPETARGSASSGEAMVHQGRNGTDRNAPVEQARA